MITNNFIRWLGLLCTRIFVFFMIIGLVIYFIGRFFTGFIFLFIPKVCPSCGKRKLKYLGVDENDDELYVCKNCGETVSEIVL